MNEINNSSCLPATLLSLPTESHSWGLYDNKKIKNKK